MAAALTTTSLAGEAQQYRIAGRVVNASSGAPLAGANVAISVVDDSGSGEEAAPPPRRGHGRGGDPMRQDRPQQPQQGQRSVVASVTTDEDGGFRFEHLDRAKYSLLASKRGYLAAAYEEHSGFSTAIVTGPGQETETLTFRLSPGAVIGGTVSDASGDPIEQASVLLFRQQDDGFGAVKQFRSANVNDSGSYEFTHVPAGTYFLGVNGKVWYATPSDGATGNHSDLDVAYPLSFYPDTTDAASAAPIPVRGGEHLTVDLPLHAVPAVHVIVSVPQARNGEQSFPVATQRAFGEALMLRPPEGIGFSKPGEGSTLSYSVAPGQYQVELGGRISNVELSGDAHYDPGTGVQLPTLSGKIALARGGSLPEGSSLTLRHAGSNDVQDTTPIAADGTFTLEHVQPDSYELEVRDEGHVYAVAQMAASGAEVNGDLLKIGTETATMAATVALASSRVTGFVGKDGKGHGGAMVVLVPKRGGDRALYHRDQSDSDGSFVMRGVAPGEYTVVAIENGWDLEWARPAVMARYLAGGVAVAVGEDARVAVKDVVPVQAR
jgi:hypothetical protein